MLYIKTGSNQEIELMCIYLLISLFIHSFFHLSTYQCDACDCLFMISSQFAQHTQWTTYIHTTCTVKRLPVLRKHDKVEIKDHTCRTDAAPASESEDGCSQRCGELKSDSGKCPPDLGGSRNLAALVLGPFASKCIVTSSYVSENSKDIKHAVDKAENFMQAKQRNRKEESSNSVKKYSSATDGSWPQV